MWFGLTNAPASWQSYMNHILSKYLDKFCIIYLDDVLVFANTLKELRERARKVLAKFQEYKLHVNLEKCIFDTDTVEFLGSILTLDRIKIDLAKVEAILN